MRLVVSERAAAYIAERGGSAWVWLDPHRVWVGSHIYLEAHAEPPRTSRRTSFTRSSRRPHRFESMSAEGITLHYAFGRQKPPEELHLDRKGWRRGTHRLEAYWNGSIFVGDDIPAPGAER
jgi:hypothetical protein